MILAAHKIADHLLAAAMILAEHKIEYRHQHVHNRHMVVAVAQCAHHHHHTVVVAVAAQTE